VILPAPQGVEPFAQEQLRQYLSNRAGRAILLLAPEIKHGLDDLLYDWGVMVDDDVILRYQPGEQSPRTGDLKITCITSQSSITQIMIDRGSSR
jgi:hypothetical protein